MASGAVTLVVFTALAILSGVTGARPGRVPLLAATFSTVIFFALAWEYVGYNFDMLIQSTYFHDLTDSVLDMAFNLAGTGLTLLALDRQMKREPADNFYRRFISP